MSIKAMTWAWGLAELPLRESMVLLALADNANDEGYCWPSQEVGCVKNLEQSLVFFFFHAAVAARSFSWSCQVWTGVR